MHLIKVVKVLWSQVSAEQLTIAMMRIVIDKSIDHAKPHLICVFTTILRSIEIFCLSASSKNIV